jgi:hypothetical protein
LGWRFLPNFEIPAILKVCHELDTKSHHNVMANFDRIIWKTSSKLGLGMAME